MSAHRRRAIEHLAAIVLAVDRPHPTRVAIDGCSAAGKTTLADELAAAVRGRPVLRVEIDRFKKALVDRTAYPPDSPEGYYLDTWDYGAVRDELLIPLGPDGDRRYRTAVMDYAGRVATPAPRQHAAADAILLADGAFLQRPELDDHWDLRVYVDVGFDEVLRRGSERDRAFLPSRAAAAARYRTKYIPGERRYLDEVRPRERAQVVVDNRDLDHPTVRLNPPRPASGRRPTAAPPTGSARRGR